MNAYPLFVSPWVWPRWLVRLLHVGIEWEIEDVPPPPTPVSVFPRWDTRRNTGRSRWTFWGVGLPYGIWPPKRCIRP